VPIRAVKAIYAFENGRGMVFGDEEDDGTTPPSSTTTTDQKIGVKKGRPELKIVK
jgi:stringent starvation protein B